MKYIDRNKNEITFDEAFNLAEEHRACSKALEYIRENLDTWTDHYKAPDWCRWYARYVIGGRWLEAEDVIMGSSLAAGWYADHVIGGRWPEAEDVIMRDPMAASWYADFLRIHEKVIK